MDIVALEHPCGKVGCVRLAFAQALDRGVLHSEGAEELERELGRVEGAAAKSETASSISTAFIVALDQTAADRGSPGVALKGATLISGARSRARAIS